MDENIISYDVVNFPFSDVVAKMLEVEDLEKLHLLARRANPENHDQDSDDHSLFYARYEMVRPLYERFLQEWILPLYGQDLAVQRVPTFRVHRPGGVAVAEFHKDSDYNHQPATINYWLPMTRAFGTNSMWVEDSPGSHTYSPIVVSPGEVLRFDAVRKQHGNYANKTDVSRASFDFRVIPLKDFADQGSSTVNTKRPISLSGYYRMLSTSGVFES